MFLFSNFAFYWTDIVKRKSLGKLVCYNNVAVLIQTCITHTWTRAQHVELRFWDWQSHSNMIGIPSHIYIQ